AVPPTVEGDIAEVNSHSIITLKACLQLRSFSDSILSLIIYPRSRPIMQHQAMNSHKTDFHVTSSRLRTEASISLKINQATMNSPRRIGMTILPGFSLLTSSYWLSWVIRRGLLASKDDIFLIKISYFRSWFFDQPVLS